MHIREIKYKIKLDISAPADSIDFDGSGCMTGAQPHSGQFAPCTVYSASESPAVFRPGAVMLQLVQHGWKFRIGSGGEK